MMTKWVAVFDRESARWHITGHVPWRPEHSYTASGRRRKKRYMQPNWVVPKPENVSCFISAHRIVEAETKEEACQLVSTFPRPRSETASQ